MFNQICLALCQNETMKRCHITVKNAYGPSLSTSCALEQKLDAELKNSFWFKVYLFYCA